MAETCESVQSEPRFVVEIATTSKRPVTVSSASTITVVSPLGDDAASGLTEAYSDAPMQVYVGGNLQDTIDVNQHVYYCATTAEPDDPLPIAVRSGKATARFHTTSFGMLPSPLLQQQSAEDLVKECIAAMNRDIGKLPLDGRKFKVANGRMVVVA